MARGMPISTVPLAGGPRPPGDAWLKCACMHACVRASGPPCCMHSCMHAHRGRGSPLQPAGSSRAPTDSLRRCKQLHRPCARMHDDASPPHARRNELGEHSTGGSLCKDRLFVWQAASWLPVCWYLPHQYTLPGPPPGPSAPRSRAARRPAQARPPHTGTWRACGG